MMQLAREADLADVLFTHYWLEEVERLEGLERESESIRQAYRMNWAFAAPKELKRERQDFDARLWRDPHAPSGLTDDEKAIAAQLVASIMGMPAVMS